MPQFGIYDQNEYKLSTIVENINNQLVTYELPLSHDGRYNILLHGLLNLNIDEKRTVKVRFTTDFDAICMGLDISASEMELEQHLHQENKQLLCSPNNGQFFIRGPVVNFNLEVIDGAKTWQFKIKLLSNIQAEM